MGRTRREYHATRDPEDAMEKPATTSRPRPRGTTWWRILRARPELVAAGCAVVVAIALARPASAEGITDLQPYVVPAGYLDHGGRELARPLGHGLYVALVFDLGMAVRNATPADLDGLGMSAARAHAISLENLERVAADGDIEMAAFPDGPGARPFVRVGGHWAAATAILLPNLRGMLAGPLGTPDLCASIPHREAMLIFGCGDRAHRDAMRALVRERESGGRKPLTFELFRLTGQGVVPLTE
jgi:hypothetical protein